MRKNRRLIRSFAFGLTMVLGLVTAAVAQPRMPPDPGDPGSGPPPPSPKALLGETLFFSTALSSPKGMSCASCHEARVGWVDERGVIDPLSRPTSEGVVAGRFGPRNSLTMTYADLGPARIFDAATGTWLGGFYWDGRAATTLEQATIPLLSPVEMNNPTVHSVVLKLKQSAAAAPFEAIYGLDVWNDPADVMDGISECLVEFETHAVLHRFDSRYDRYLRGDATALTAVEKNGLDLFMGKGGCAACHPASMRPDGTLPRFTTYRYYNLGVPRNPRNPFYDMPASINPDGHDWVDYGLGKTLGHPDNEDAKSEIGKFRVPTLRNVALSGPFMHNGVFTRLEDVVEFHNTRDIPGRWDPPEVPDNLSFGPVQVRAPLALEGGPILLPPSDEPGGMPIRLGNHGLTATEVDRIVAFLRTLSDETVLTP